MHSTHSCFIYIASHILTKELSNEAWHWKKGAGFLKSYDLGGDWTQFLVNSLTFKSVCVVLEGLPLNESVPSTHCKERTKPHINLPQYNLSCQMKIMILLTDRNFSTSFFWSGWWRRSKITFVLVFRTSGSIYIISIARVWDIISSNTSI